MKTVEEIKNICSQSNNYGMSESEYKIFDQYTTDLCEAWGSWPDNVTREFWEGEEKPEKPTNSFQDDFFQNYEFEELM